MTVLAGWLSGGGAEKAKNSPVFSTGCFGVILQIPYLQEGFQNFFPWEVKVTHFADKGTD